VSEGVFFGLTSEEEVVVEAETPPSEEEPLTAALLFETSLCPQEARATKAKEDRTNTEKCFLFIVFLLKRRFDDNRPGRAPLPPYGWIFVPFFSLRSLAQEKANVTGWDGPLAFLFALMASFFVKTET
jgi:hypothetical protein